MSALDDIYSGLTEGLRAAESLRTWQRRAYGMDRADDYAESCRRGLKALETLRAELRDGRKHIEPSARWEKPTACFCNATSHPPCSFCTSDHE